MRAVSVDQAFTAQWGTSCFLPQASDFVRKPFLNGDAALHSSVARQIKCPPLAGAFDEDRSCYLGGDSVLEAAPAGPVVVFGIDSGAPLAPPLSVIPEPPPDDVPVVSCFIALEFVFVIAGLFRSSV
jgi:hypothetical protein